jgi:hypothetical protein
MDHEDRPETGTDGAQFRTSRRAFLSAAAVGAVAGLAGCSVTVDAGGGGRDDDGPTQSATGRDPTATTTPPTATATPPPTTTTETATATTETGTPEYEVVTAQPRTPEYEVVTMEPRTPEYEVVTPDPASARYRIHNVKLYLVNANDSALNGPNTEEIWGNVFVKGYDARDGSEVFPEGAEGAFVYGIDRDDAVGLGDGGMRRLPIDVVVGFPDPATVDRGGSYVSLGANLFERDGRRSADDELGWWDTGHRYDWSLAQDPTDPDRADPNGESQFVVYYDDRGTELHLSFDVTPVE